MFVLFVLSTVNTLELSNFQNFIIKFNETCEECFLMQGPIDYLYFYQRNNQFELWHIQNDSYEIYLFEGTISKPFDFNRTSIMCNFIHQDEYSSLRTSHKNSKHFAKQKD